MAAPSVSEPDIAAVRRFNRFYTQQIGVLDDRLLESPYSLTEVRILYEVRYCTEPTAVELCRDLGLDAGYLSRILGKFQKKGLVKRRRSESDGRQSHLRLTEKGSKEFALLDSRSNQQVGAQLMKLSQQNRTSLVEAMRTIESMLGPAAKFGRPPWVLRPHRPGDMGWVVHRHGALYHQEYGWNEEFEALVADIVATFIKNFDSNLEHCWIAESRGQIVGSVFLVKQSPTMAKLRLLLVEPEARGLGLGKNLVDECIRFARQVGYRKMTLWTQSVLGAARRIYQQAGFQLVQEQPHHSFGHDLVAQTWELTL